LDGEEVSDFGRVARVVARNGAAEWGWILWLVNSPAAHTLSARDDLLHEQLEACLVRFHLVLRWHRLLCTNERVRVQVRDRSSTIF